MEEKKKDSFLKHAFVTQTKGFIDISHRRELWEQIAAEFNGKFSIRHTTDKLTEQLKIEIPYKNIIIELCESDTRPLKMEFHFNTNTDFNFSITWEDTIEKFLKLFGQQDIIIGEDEFDKKFLIKSNKPGLLKQILEKDIISQIIKHNVYSYTCTYKKSGKNSNITCVINRTTYQYETMKELINLQCMLIDIFEKAGLISQ